MRTSEEIAEIAKSLSALTYSEWYRISGAVDMYFHIKKGEMKRELHLPDAKKLAELIRSQFGCE